MDYLFKAMVVVGETMKGTAEVESLFQARNDEAAREFCKRVLSKNHVLANERKYRLFKEIPTEKSDPVYDH